jgi:2-octaprenyl-6-methoxyphenol hydroxylase
LVDARPLESLQRDRRLLALSRGSLLLLESLLGSGFAPMAPIERVHVSSQGDAGAALLGERDFPGACVGATVWYADLVTALAAAAQAQNLIHVERPRRAVRIEQQSDHVRILLDGAATLEARLAVDAEGTPARAPQAKNFALLADIELSQVAPGDAIERFTRDGPLALLPLPPVPLAQREQAARAASAPSGASVPMRMSMIWCQPAALARTRLEMDQDQLCEQIARALGPRLGRPTAIGPRHIFPLTTHRLERICEHRLVHLGNAAQSLHPVAGQGFNLGIRDCACLVEALIDVPWVSPRKDPGTPRGPAQELGQPGDPVQALARYRRRRRLDRRLLPALTSALPALFSSNLAPVAAARSAGLIALDAIPGLRRAFTRLLMFGPE